MFNLENLTQLNILKEIWVKNTFTRNYIKEKLNIDKSTVTRNFNSMIKEKIFYETNIISPGKKGGRKTQEFKRNDDLCYFISIAVIDGRVLALLENFGGVIVRKIERKIRINSNDSFIETVIGCIDELKEMEEEKFKEVLSINVAIPGLIDSNNGFIRYSSEMNLNDLNLRKELGNRYGKYITVENDANAASANSLFLSDFTDKNCIYFLFFLPENLLSLNEIGAGIIIDSKIYKGNSSSAGEVRIKNYWMLPNIDQVETLQLECLDEKVLNENEDIRNYICNFSERIASVIHFMDPNKIILGGDIRNFSDYLRNYTVQMIFEYSSSKYNEKFVQIDYGGLESVAKGATISFLISFMDNFELAKKILSRFSRNYDS